MFPIYTTMIILHELPEQVTNIRHRNDSSVEEESNYTKKSWDSISEPVSS